MSFRTSKLFLLALLGFLCESAIKVDDFPADVRKSPFYRDGAMHIPISKKASEDLYKHWVDQAFSGLMAAMTTAKMSVASESEKNMHQECAKRAKTVQTHAQCVIHLFDSVEKRRRHQLTRFFNKLTKSSRVVPSTNVRKKIPMEWVGGFRTSRFKRSVVNQATYNLIGENDRSPIGHLARHLTNTIRIFKNKTEKSRWPTILTEIHLKAKEMMKRKEMEKNMRKRMIKFLNVAESFDLLPNVDKKRPLAMPEMEEFFDGFDEKNMLNDANEKIKRLPPEQKAINAPAQLVREAIKLGMIATGQNVSGFEEKSLKIISPRIMSILPKEENSKNKEINVLSPSLFSLHDEGTGFEKITSLSALLGGLKGSGQQDWLNFIIEASGVSDAVEMATKIKNSEQSKYDFNTARSSEGRPLYFTKENVTKMYGDFEKRKIEIFEKLQTTFSNKQLHEMNRTGYAILSPSQRQLVYGSLSPFNNSATLHAIANISESEVHRSVSATVRNVANGYAQFEVRQHDIVLSPIVKTNMIGVPELASQPLILSPVLLSTLIGSPAIFGAVILSPWVFIPVIASPRLLSPVVLSPFVFAPIILTPLVFVPVILSAGIFNPFVLSPFLLSPFILSPQAFTPLILSPFALSPFIATPTFLSPLVLSPFVLSPSVLSPSYISAVILSPYALSPAINSTGAAVTVIASPSWLS